MGSVGANEENKRRLPSWMMGAPASNLVRGENKEDRVCGSVSETEVALPKSKKRSRKIVKKSSIKDKEDGISEEASSPKLKTRSRKIVNRNHDEGELKEANDSEEVHVPKSKRRLERTAHEDREVDADNSCLLVKCDKTKRKRKTNLQAADSDVNSTVSEKFVHIDEPQRKKKGIGNKVTAKEVSSSFTDSGRQLHMEDLIRIAEGYVKADNHTEQLQQQPLKVGACVPDDKFYAADAPFDGSTSLFDVPQNKCSSAAIEANWTSSTSSEQVQNKSSFSNISRTGDPAQDMLNLLLGPLLSKPEDECKKTLNSDDMLFDRPTRNQDLNRIAEDLAPTVKKKTSLKDKVAMFLD